MQIGHLIVDKNDIKRFTIERYSSVDIRVTLYFYSGGMVTNIRPISEDKINELTELINSR